MIALLGINQALCQKNFFLPDISSYWVFLVICLISAGITDCLDSSYGENNCIEQTMYNL